MGTIVIAIIAAALGIYSTTTYRKLKATHRKLKEKDIELTEMKNREKKLIKKAEALNARNSEQAKAILSMEDFIDVQDKVLRNYRKDLFGDVDK
jgi:hypothetical protein